MTTFLRESKKTKKGRIVCYWLSCSISPQCFDRMLFLVLEKQYPWGFLLFYMFLMMGSISQKINNMWSMVCSLIHFNLLQFIFCQKTHMHVPRDTYVCSLDIKTVDFWKNVMYKHCTFYILHLSAEYTQTAWYCEYCSKGDAPTAT